MALRNRELHARTDDDDNDMITTATSDILVITVIINKLIFPIVCDCSVLVTFCFGAPAPATQCVDVFTY